MAGKQNIKEWLAKNFEKVILFGVIGLIIVSMVYIAIHPSPVKKKEEKLLKLGARIDERIENEEVKCPCVAESVNPNFLTRARAPFINVPTARTGPAWVVHRIPYIKKNWYVSKPKTFKHPALAAPVALDMNNKIKVTWKGGKWETGASGKVKYCRFKLERKKGKNGKWEVVYEVTRDMINGDPDHEYEYTDEKDYQENTEYTYRVSSEAEVTAKDLDMVKLDETKLGPTAHVSVKTMFRFKITHPSVMMDSCIMSLTIIQQLTHEDELLWVKWPNPRLFRMTESNKKPPTGMNKYDWKLKYLPYDKKQEKIRCDVVDEDGNRIKVGGKYRKVKVSIASLDTGYDLLNFIIEKKDPTSGDVVGYTLKLKNRTTRNIVEFTYDSFRKLVAQGAGSPAPE